MNTRLRGLIAVAAVITMVAVGLSTGGGFDAGAAPADTDPPPGCVDVSPETDAVVCTRTPDAGLLRLHLGAGANGDYFQFEPVEGLPSTQYIRTAGCDATLEGSPLVTLAPGPAPLPAPQDVPRGTLGQRRDSLGVRFNEGGGEPCAQVNNTRDTDSQSLILSLGSALRAEGALVDWAEIDLERKFDGVVRAEFFEGGPAGTSTGQLLLGCSASLSDCGPDSTDGDNFRFNTLHPPDVLQGPQQPPDPFDTIVLSLDPSGPANGAFSLEGGADGTTPGPFGSTLSVNPNDSIFHVVTRETTTYEGTLDCADTVTVAVPSDPASPATSSSVARMQNKEGNCILVPYNLTAGYNATTGEQTVDFNVDLTDQQFAEFEWRVEWDPETATYPLNPTSINFGDGPGPLQWCGGTYDPVPLTADARMANVVPINGLGGCLAQQQPVLTAGKVQVTEVLLLSEDPRVSR